MRLVDVNADAAAPLMAGTTEVWAIDPRARQGDPAEFDGPGDGDRRTRRCLVAMPGPLADLEWRVAAYRAAGAPAVVRLFPGLAGHGYPLEPWALSPLPEYCEREELALAIDVMAGPAGYPWAEIVRFSRAYPRLPILALGAPLAGATAARALDAAPNLILDTSGLGGASAAADLAELVRTRGAYRIAYGSGAARIDISVLSDQLAGADAEMVSAGTADHLAKATWGATYL